MLAIALWVIIFAYIFYRQWQTRRYLRSHLRDTVAPELKHEIESEEARDAHAVRRFKQALEGAQKRAEMR